VSSQRGFFRKFVFWGKMFTHSKGGLRKPRATRGCERKIYDLCTQALSSTLVSPVESTSTSRRLEVMRCDGCRCCVCHAPSKSKACWNPETTHDGQFQIELCKPSPASCLSQSESTRHSESAQPAMPQESIHRIIEKPPSKLEPRQPRAQCGS
jgi:hypothetical protein